MSDTNLEIANERSGMNTIWKTFQIITAFMIGVVISCGILSDFGQPTKTMLILMVISIGAFVGNAILIAIVGFQRDRLLKLMEGESK